MTSDKRIDKKFKNENAKRQEEFTPLSVAFVIPYPTRDSHSFIYVRESSKSVYQLPHVPIEKATQLPGRDSIITLRGMETRVRIGPLLGVYAWAEHDNEKGSITLAYAALRVEGKLNIFERDKIADVRIFEIADLSEKVSDDLYRGFYGGLRSIQPALDFLAGKFIPEDRIMRA